MGEPEELDKYRAPALDKGLDILELLASTEDSLSQAEIAKALERSPNEIYRMLDRLVRRGYVRRTPADRYEVTLKLFELAHARPPLQRLIHHAVPVMRRLAREGQQACQLSIYDRGTLVVAAQVMDRATGTSRSGSARVSGSSIPARAMCCSPMRRRRNAGRCWPSRSSRKRSRRRSKNG